MMNAIEVVAGLIVRGGRLLVCQRKRDASFPLKWEFPGGKVEVGESHEEALLRELKEELGIDASNLREIYRHQQAYSSAATVNLRFYRVGTFSGVMRNLVFEDIAWVYFCELSRVEFLEGDSPLVKHLASPAGRKLLT